jgi:hypothetical protein
MEEWAGDVLFLKTDDGQPNGGMGSGNFGFETRCPGEMNLFDNCHHGTLTGLLSVAGICC